MNRHTITVSFQHHFFTLKSGYKLHYTGWGDIITPDTQVIICVHGLTRNARDFDFLADYLLNYSKHSNYYIICVDIIGRGKSDWAINPDEYTVAHYAEQCLELITFLKQTYSLKSAPHWIGTSMGGLIAMTLQLLSPHQFNKIVFNDIAPVIEPSGLQKIADYIGHTSYFDNQDAANAYVKIAFKPFGAKTDQEWDLLSKHYFVPYNQNNQNNQNQNNKNNNNLNSNLSLTVHYDLRIADTFKQGVFLQTQDSLVATQTALWNSISTIQSPILVLRGEYSTLLSDETLQQFKRVNFNTTTHTITGCGHAPHLMNDDQCKIIADFLLN